MKGMRGSKITGKPGPKNHYINNEEFYQLLVAYRKTVISAQSVGQPIPRIPDSIGEIFLKIANNLSHKPCFCGYPYRQEMISYAVENCVKSINNYGIEEGDPQNPFSYFTQMIYWAFVRKIKQEKATRYSDCKIIEKTITHHDNPSVSLTWYTAPNKPVQDFIGTYEAAKKKEKLKKAKNKAEDLSLESCLEDVEN